MAKVKVSTRLESDLLNKIKEKVSQEELSGVNAVIEEALRIYFANHQTEVWEKKLPDGTLQKLTVRPDKIMLENIKARKMTRKFDPQHFTKEALEPIGWTLVWKMKPLPAVLRVVSSEQ